MKRCTKCQRDLDESEYYVCKKRNIIKTPCKECTREYQKGNNPKRVAHYHANKEFMRAAYRKGGIYAKERDYKIENERQKEYNKEYRERKRKDPAYQYRRIQRGAKTRGIDFALTYEEYETIWNKPCFYSDDEATGLDRIDSDKGYTIDNVVPCCAFCNYAKGTHTQAEFMEQISKIYRKHFG